MLIIELIQGRRCRIIGTEFAELEGEIIDVTDEARPIIVLLDNGNEVDFSCSEVEIL